MRGFLAFFTRLNTGCVRNRFAYYLAAAFHIRQAQVKLGQALTKSGINRYWLIGKNTITTSAEVIKAQIFLN